MWVEQFKGFELTYKKARVEVSADKLNNFSTNTLNARKVCICSNF